MARLSTRVQTVVVRTTPISPSIADVLWVNQRAMNGRASEAGRTFQDRVSEALIRNICRHVLVPDGVFVRPMTKPVEVFKYPSGADIEGPFYALSRFLLTRWCSNENDLAFKIGREISMEIIYDVVSARAEATRKSPFRGMIYAPHTLVQLTDHVDEGVIGVMTRYSKRILA